MLVKKLEALKRIQEEELIVLKSLKNTCEKYGIKYYLGYGTLLGAVRHKGFIPWDDDVDMFMPRKDYERFKRIAKKAVDKPYILTGNIADSKEPIISIKIRVENPNIQFLIEKNGAKIKQNIWVDIFPIDGLPKTRLGRKLIFLYFRILFIEQRLGRSSRVGIQEGKERSLVEKIGIFVNKHMHIGKIINTNKVAKKFDSIRCRFPYETSEYVCPLTIDYMEKCICKREWFGEGIMCSFEGTDFNIPINSDAVLKQFYGDYMKLPPLKDRVSKHSIKLVEMKKESNRDA